MTITHPFHPLHGQQVALLRVRSGRHAALIVRFPTGIVAGIPADWTDYLPSPAPTAGSADALPRLDGNGLRAIVDLLSRWQREAPAAGVAPGDAPAGKRMLSR